MGGEKSLIKQNNSDTIKETLQGRTRDLVQKIIKIHGLEFAPRVLAIMEIFNVK
jgi:hypothetical protein